MALAPARVRLAAPSPCPVEARALAAGRGAGRALLGPLICAAILFAVGAATGAATFARLDPLRRDSAVMEAWFRANVAGDTEAMWQMESADYHARFTSGHDAYVAEYAHAPTAQPPTIRFVASVPLPDSGRELFYDFDFGPRGHSVVAVYVDAQGRFDGPAI